MLISVSSSLVLSLISEEHRSAIESVSGTGETLERSCNTTTSRELLVDSLLSSRKFTHQPHRTQLTPSAFINAGYSYSGTEVVVLTASEASAPSKQIPKAARRVIYRIGLFNIGSALIVGMIVPYTNPDLVSGSGNAASSPWVIAITGAGIKVLPSIINACILTSAWSAGNSYVYVASRTLVGLASGGHAPRFLLKVNKHGVPYYAVICTLFMGLLAYLSVGSGGASQAFSWFQSMTALAGILAWGVLCLAYIRMHAALKAQGISRDSLPWKSMFQPYGAWFGMIVSFIIVIFSGFTVFIKGNWDTSAFFANYISESATAAYPEQEHR